MDRPQRRPSRVDQIVAHVALLVETGAYRIDERLPSVRQAAQEYEVSKNTMAEAYDRFVARGVLEGRIGSGYYVTQFAAPLATIMTRARSVSIILASSSSLASWPSPCQEISQFWQ